ncbi:hypothetical protein, partial [Escherichia coli]
GHRYAPGQTIPAGTTLSFLYIPATKASSVGGVFSSPSGPALPAAQGTSAWAVMLPSGSQSASLRLTAGADLTAADQRGLQTVGALSGAGNLTLNDPTYGNFGQGTFYSVVRTGTGSLELLAG